MSSVTKHYRLAAVAVGLLLARSTMAAEAASGNLVNAQWLSQNLRATDLLVLDGSAGRAYAAQHIPGAVSADLFLYGVPEATTAVVEQRFRSWGISPGKRIVLYDEGAGMMATRLFFSLCYYGFPEKDLLILDGGLAKWREQGLPVTKEVTPAPARGSFTIKSLRRGLRAELPAVVNASGDTKRSVLVEALGADWHFGQVAAFDKPGHIPNSVLLPSADFYRPDKTFKSAAEMRKMLAYRGIRREQEIVTYCGGGVAASVPFFALKYLLGYPSVKLSVESEIGWLSDDRGLPYWTYDAPFLMRDANWLRSWNGPMFRRFGVTRFSIVDVRPVAAFDQGHVAFAINVPGDVFSGNLGNPARLAAILGPAGVDASQEAVVVSGAGLTREAALAFVMLESVGQKRVSILMDPMDRWGSLGLAVTKDATLVGPKKGPEDLSIPPTAYRANPTKAIVTTDAKTAQGLFPKVFIASGKDVPARAQDGKVVHVPYTDLLNPDGTPKAAKDIWSILAKAGVPMYAELVCYSDDPGEAAVNYVILKLMGFPDAKVLVI